MDALEFLEEPQSETAEAFLGTEPATPAKPKRERDGWDYVVDAVRRGVRQAQQVRNVETGDAEGIAHVAREQAALEPSPALRRFQGAKGWKAAVQALAADPVQVGAELVGESLGAYLPVAAKKMPEHVGTGIVTGAAAAGALGQAGPQAATPEELITVPAGAAIGAQAGFLTGTYATSLALEYSGKILDVLRESGVDLANAEQLEEAFRNQQLMAAARHKALLKGVPVAIFDGFSAGIAGKLVTTPARTVAGKAGQAAAEVGTQAALGMAGELQGQLLAEEFLDAPSILAEGVAELGPGAAEVAIGAVTQRAGRPAAVAPAPAAGEVPSAEAFLEAPEAEAAVDAALAALGESKRLDGAELQGEVEGVPVARVPGGQIAVRPDLMQFKRIDDAAAGVNAEDRLEGQWDDLKAGNLLLWEPANPAEHGLRPEERYIIANGHHRFEFGRRKGVPEFNVQVVREADGVSAAEARLLGAEINIAEGRGNIYDQTKFLRNVRATYGTDAAVARAGRTGVKGRKAATIGFNAGDPLFDSFINEQVTPDQAEAIARTAPGDDGLQRLGIAEARRGMGPALLQNFLQVVRAQLGAGSVEQLDMFGANDTALNEARRLAERARKLRGELDKQVRATENAARNATMAKRKGVEFKRDPVEILAENERLTAERGRWEQWAMHPDLVAQVKGQGLIAGSAAEKWADGVLAQGALNTGLNPEQLAAYAVKGAALIERGARDFAGWSRRMVELYGPWVQQWLEDIWRAANERWGDATRFDGFGVPRAPEVLPAGHPLLEETLGKATLPDGRDREAWRAEQVARVLGMAEPVAADEQPVVVFTGGGGGAGKSTMLDKLRRMGLVLSSNYVHVNADSFKTGEDIPPSVGLEPIPEFELVRAAGDSRAVGVIHEESSLMAKTTFARALSQRKNLVYDAALSSARSAGALMDAARQQGYRIILVGVTVDPEAAIARATMRAFRNGRWIQPRILLAAHRGFARAFESYVPQVDELYLWDNNGSDAILAAEKRDDKGLVIHNQEAYSRFGRNREVNEQAQSPNEIWQANPAVLRDAGDAAGAEGGGQGGGRADFQREAGADYALGGRPVDPAVLHDRPAQASFQVTPAAGRAEQGELFGYPIEPPKPPRRPKPAGKGAPAEAVQGRIRFLQSEHARLEARIRYYGADTTRRNNELPRLRYIQGQIDMLKEIAEARDQVREAWFDLFKLGIVANPQEDARKVYALYRALVSLAEVYAKHGMRTATDFARATGLKLTRVVQQAWDDAVAKTPRPALDWDVVDEAAMEMGPRRFSQRLAADTRRSARVRTETGNRDYLPMPNKLTLAEALAVIQERGIDASIVVVKDENNGLGERVRVVLGQALIQQLDAQGQAETKAGKPVAADLAFSKAVDVAEWLTEYGTRLGQGVQAFAVWGRLTPQGFLAAYKRVLNKAQRQMRRRPGLAATLGLKKAPQYDKGIAAEVVRRARRVQGLPEGFQRQEAVIDVLAFIERQRGLSWWDIGLAYWYANILSGLTTQAINIASTASNVLLEAATHAVLSPGAVPQMLVGLYQGIIRGGLEGAAVLKTGKVTGTRVRKLEAPRVLEMLQLRGPARVFHAWRYVFRVMAAADMVAFRSAEEMKVRFLARKVAKAQGLKGDALSARVAELVHDRASDRAAAAAQATAEGLSGLSYQRRVREVLEQMRPESLVSPAAEFGQAATYNQDPDGVLGAIARGINQISANVPGLRFIVPFTHIVSNVTNTALNYTPWGYKRLFLGSWGGDVAGRPAPELWSDEFKLQAARATLGTVGLVGLYALAAQYQDDEDPPFMITAQGPADPRARSQLMETGWRPYTVKMGDRYVSYLYTPLGLGMAIVGNLVDATRYRKMDEQDAGVRVAYALQQVGVTVLNQSFLTGLSDFFRSLQADRPDTNGKLFAGTARLATSFVVPNLVKQVDRIFDPTVYQADTIAGAMMRDMPVARRGLDPRLNALGEPVESSVNRFVSAERPDAVWTTLAAKQAWVSGPSKATMVGDRTIRPDEYYLLVRESGRGIRARLERDLERIRYMTAEEAQEHVSEIATQERRKARAKLFR